MYWLQSQSDTVEKMLQRHLT